MLKMISFDKENIDIGAEPTTLRSAYPFLLIVIEGQAFFGKQRLSTSEGVFVRAGVSFSIKPDESQTCSLLKIVFDGNINDTVLKDRNLTNSTNSVSYFSVDSLQKLISVTDILLPDDKLSSDTIYSEALALLILSFVRTNDDRSSYGNDYVDRAVRYINDNIANVIRVEELASYLGIDRMYLRNLFVKHTGISTMEYVMHTRMERAKVLLGNKHLTVTDVANEVGYPDILSFSKAFKKYSGVCPSEFRNEQIRNVVKSKKKEQIPVFIL